MADRNSLTAVALREALYYDPVTGVFTWLVQPQIAGKVRVGDVAGRIDSKGYLRIGLGGNQYRAHRLAWLYMTGTWPAVEVDHEDRCPLHNWWSNLRLATSGQNKQNVGVRRDNTSGCRGVSWATRHKVWLVQITCNGIRKHVGHFPTLAEAISARERVEKELFTHAPTTRSAQ